MWGAGEIQDGRWSLTGRFVLVDSDRSPVEFSLTHRLRDDLQIGIEYDAEEGQLFPLVNWRLVDAEGARPALALGVSSAWPSREVDGSALFVTAARHLGEGLSASVSLSWGLEDERLRVPASLSYSLGDSASAMVLYDGDNAHPMLTFRGGSLSTSLILMGGTDPTISLSWGF
ncbi:MAG: hypothetical protein QF903_07785 [Planctomycetota bacterium]|nr:hypothetical protein [Planctomycetota bacterium]MDP6762760.1 hypothetical protein [Planctomycetota bacterium]MDP6989365.1 hypothetical protein [Planctomycetota bacterium]